MCQVIELSLKVLIARKQHYFELEAGKDISSITIYDELLDKPLTVLIKRLQKIGGNKILIEKLKAVNGERNYLAHQALLQSYQGISDFLESIDGAKTFDFISLHNQLIDCLNLIVEEAQAYLSEKNL